MEQAGHSGRRAGVDLRRRKIADFGNGEPASFGAHPDFLGHALGAGTLEPDRSIHLECWPCPTTDPQADLAPCRPAVSAGGGRQPAFWREFWNNPRAGADDVDLPGEYCSLSGPVRLEARVAGISPSPSRSGVGMVVAGMIERKLIGYQPPGHVFPDGPAPRSCDTIDNARFIPVDNLEAEGYGEYRPLFPA